MKKTIEGYLFNRIETLGKEKHNHIGFENDDNSFGDMLESIVPEIGTRKKAKLTIELLEDREN